MHWQRIVLDEAHAIKDRRCSTAQAAFALAATFRWCLSGTPLQNRVGEFYSLVQFLRLDPYCYYFCKAKVDGGTCNCKCREYNFDAEWRYCRDCGHTPLQHYSLFNRDIVNPIRKFGYVGAGRSGFLSLKRGVLDKCLLRRTKAGRADEMVLPPKADHARLQLPRRARGRLLQRAVRHVTRTEGERCPALSLTPHRPAGPLPLPRRYTQSQVQFNAYVQAETLLNNYAHILDLLTRLRQAIDHPYLVLHSKRGEEAAADGAGIAGGAQYGDGGAICGLCFEDAEAPVTARCGHVFCRECVSSYLETIAADAARLVPHLPRHPLRRPRRAAAAAARAAPPPARAAAAAAGGSRGRGSSLGSSCRTSSRRRRSRR